LLFLVPVPGCSQSETTNRDMGCSLFAEEEAFRPIGPDRDVVFDSTLDAVLRCEVVVDLADRSAGVIRVHTRTTQPLGFQINVESFQIYDEHGDPNPVMGQWYTMRVVPVPAEVDSSFLAADDMHIKQFDREIREQVGHSRLRRGGSTKLP